jgi:phytoene synthase
MSKKNTLLQKYTNAYYWSTKFLPRQARDDVFKLYSFVQFIDGITDITSPNKKQFTLIEQRWKQIKKHIDEGVVPAQVDDSATEYALKNITYVLHRYRCDTAWVDAFLLSKKWDLEKHVYKSFKDTESYMYGSSEAIGLVLAQILSLPEESFRSVRMQCRALQIIDFLREIKCNNELERCYFPANEIKMHGLKNLSYQEALVKPNMFTDFVQSQLLRYATWQTEANAGKYYIPKKLRVPMQTTIDAYNLTAQHIKNDPMTIFMHRIKLQKRSIVFGAIKNSVKKSK